MQQHVARKSGKGFKDAKLKCTAFVRSTIVKRVVCGMNVLDHTMPVIGILGMPFMRASLSATRAQSFDSQQCFCMHSIYTETPDGGATIPDQSHIYQQWLCIGLELVMAISIVPAQPLKETHIIGGTFLAYRSSRVMEQIMLGCHHPIESFLHWDLKCLLKPSLVHA